MQFWHNCLSECCRLKMYTRQEVAIFWQIMQISNRIPTDSCKFPTDKIKGVLNISTLVPNFCKMVGSTTNYAFLSKNFLPIFWTPYHNATSVYLWKSYRMITIKNRENKPNLCPKIWDQIWQKITVEPDILTLKWVSDVNLPSISVSVKLIAYNAPNTNRIYNNKY